MTPNLMLANEDHQLPMTVSSLGDLGTLSMDLIEIPPGHIKEPVLHYECEEILYILEGTLELIVGAQTRIMNTGDHVLLPRGTVHGSVNRSGRVVRMLAANSPAYKIEFEHLVTERGHK
jgi:mannose-6-phosphate isomerase-like protein (cupin superfamily)